MAGVNKVILVGNLGADPETRSLNNGGNVCNFSLATSESWKDRDGNRQERTEWHRIVSFNEGLNSVIQNYLRKGSKVYLEGQIQTRKWTDQSGADRYSTEIVLPKFNGQLVMLDSANSGGGGGYDRDSRGNRQNERDEDAQRDFHGMTGGGGRQQQRPQPAAFDTDLDDDVPF